MPTKMPPILLRTEGILTSDILHLTSYIIHLPSSIIHLPSLRCELAEVDTELLVLVVVQDDFFHVNGDLQWEDGPDRQVVECDDVCVVLLAAVITVDGEAVRCCELAQAADGLCPCLDGGVDGYGVWFYHLSE